MARPPAVARQHKPAVRAAAVQRVLGQRPEVWDVLGDDGALLALRRLKDGDIGP